LINCNKNLKIWSNKKFEEINIRMIRKRIVFLLSLVVFQLQAQEKKWTLQECVDYAIKNNISVQSSALDLQTAGIAKKMQLVILCPILMHQLLTHGTWV
jgi:hypothetical protein